MLETLFYIALLGLTLILAGMVILPALFGAPWHPTPIRTVKKILAFIDPQPGQKFYDLGSGDGRVLIVAARYYGLQCVGLEIDPVKAWLSRWLIKFTGVEDRVKILRRSFFDFDFTDGDILFVYLSHQAIDRLLPHMVERLKPTVKIVCYGFCLRSLTPERVSSDRRIFIYQLNKGNRVNGFS